jgi:hypothetical protein
MLCRYSSSILETIDTRPTLVPLGSLAARCRTSMRAEGVVASLGGGKRGPIILKLPASPLYSHLNNHIGRRAQAVDRLLEPP